MSGFPPDARTVASVTIASVTIASVTIASVTIGLFALSSCRPSLNAGRLPVNPPGAIDRLDLPRLPPSGVIDDLDVALLPDGTELVVWQSRSAREATSPAAASPAAVAVRAHAPGAADWGAPVSIPGAGAPLRLVVGGHSVHLLAGMALRHWISDDSGGRWASADAERPFSELVLGFDALPESTGVRIVALVRTPGADDGGRRLVTWVATDAGSTPPVTVARFSDITEGDVAGPMAARRGNTLGVVVGLNGLETVSEVRNGRPVEVSRGAARVAVIMSPDGGARWEAPVTLESADGALSMVAGVDISGDGPAGWSVACGAFGLLLAERSEGGTWSPLQRLAAYTPGLSGGTATTNVCFANNANEMRLVWVDERYRESDRKPWNPLGGFPWSDAPEWANNDLFTMSRSPPDSGWDLRRLTPDLSRTDRVAVASSGTTRLVAWAGRTKVGKRVDSAGEGPALFLARFQETR